MVLYNCNKNKSDCNITALNSGHCFLGNIALVLLLLNPSFSFQELFLQQFYVIENAWKIAKVVPIFKKGERCNIKVIDQLQF